MRKSLLCLALLGGVFFTLGAMPATAGAANCTYLVSGPTIVQGAFFHGGNVGSCTGVNRVRWYGSANQNSGWYDNTLSAPFGALFITGISVYPGPPTYIDQGGTTSYSVTYQTACWYGATTTHMLQTQFSYALHNSATNTWGPIHYVAGGPVYTSGC